MIALYTEHNFFLFLFMYKHSSTHTSVGKWKRKHACLMCEKESNSFKGCITFCKNQWNLFSSVKLMVELLFMFADQYLNVNKILNSITSSFIAIVSENLD